MSPVPQTLPRERILALLREQPARTAILCDIDGTLAPVVDRPEEASVPAPTRRVLEALSDRYALVACISGRQAKEARRMVGLDSLTYIGNHGLERLAPGAAKPEVDPGAEAPRRPRAGVRLRAFRRPGAGRRRAARGQGRDLGLPLARRPRPRRRPRAARAGRRGGPGGRPRPALGAHGARDPARRRRSTRAPPSPPPSPARRSAPRSTPATTRRTWTPSGALRALQAEGALELGVCVGVTSPEGPAEIATEADLVVDGPDELRELLAELAS